MTDLSDLSRADVIRELEELVFTAARDWRRSVKLDAAARDMIVRALLNERKS